MLCCPQGRQEKGEKSMKKEAWNEGWLVRHLNTNDAWQQITLPYDCMIHEQRSDDAEGGCNNGWFMGYDYELMKRFRCSDMQLKRRIRTYLELEAVYRQGEVYCNDQLVVKRDNGYLNLTGELTPYLREGENTVRVIAHNAQMPSARWYTGAGIYRPAWWYEVPRKHILLHSLRIKTISISPAKVQVSGQTSEAGTVTVEILDGTKSMTAGKTQSDGTFSIVLDVPNAVCWDTEHPQCYDCRVCFEEDVWQKWFGIRTISCDAKNGFCLNGQRVLLRGACIHHDNGLLGAAEYPDAVERKVQLLKSVGYNAIRSAHNPCSEALLAACDRNGMLVMDEYEDAWLIHKTKYDYADFLPNNYPQDIQDLVQKDYNHPCVVLYSLGNEVSESAKPEGVALFERMKAYLRTLDDSRPVTCGINIGFNQAMAAGHPFFSNERTMNTDVHDLGTEEKNHRKWKYGSLTMKLNALMPGSDRATREIFAASDVSGYNYGLFRYRMDRRKYPNRVILGSETFCVDTEHFLRAAARDQGIIGDFVWTGIDHLGEVGLGAWEWREDAPTFLHSSGWLTSGAGRIDITGKLLPEAYYTCAAYGLLKKPYIAVEPPNHRSERHSPSGWKMTSAVASWAWNGYEGKKCRVEVYGCGDHVSLFLNGVRQGTKSLKRKCRVFFQLAYQPGVLTAILYNEKNEKMASSSLLSLDGQKKLMLEPEKRETATEELCYVRLRVTDSAGTTDVLARDKVRIQVTGGELLAFGHACPYNKDGYDRNETTVYCGEAMAILRAHQSGLMHLTAASACETAEIDIPVR